MDDRNTFSGWEGQGGSQAIPIVDRNFDRLVKRILRLPASILKKRQEDRGLFGEVVVNAEGTQGKPSRMQVLWSRGRMQLIRNPALFPSAMHAGVQWGCIEEDLPFAWVRSPKGESSWGDGETCVPVSFPCQKMKFRQTMDHLRTNEFALRQFAFRHRRRLSISMEIRFGHKRRL